MEENDIIEPKLSEHRYRELLIDFYEERLAYYMGNVGRRTEYKTLITPALISTTIKRLKQLVDRYDITSRRLL